MRSICAAVTLPVLAAFSVAHSDGVIYETDFSQPPANWYYDQDWEFGNDGAVVQTDLHFWDALMFSGGPGDQLIFFVPDGADSIGIAIPYYLNASVDQGNVCFEIRFGCTDSGWETIWERSEYSGYVSETDTISYSPDYVQGGDWVGINFEGFGECDTWGYMGVTWQIHGLTITAFGDSLSFESSTWAGIKAAGDSE
ncbi:MAG: hypothetical protein R6U36_10965 [Candidatus Fermentibacteraceae bacterium]